MTTDDVTTRRDELPVSYDVTLQRLAIEVRSANIRAIRMVNAELINLSADPRAQFPRMKGLSARNMRHMRRFAAEFLDSI